MFLAARSFRCGRSEQCSSSCRVSSQTRRLLERPEGFGQNSSIACPWRQSELMRRALKWPIAHVCPPNHRSHRPEVASRFRSSSTPLCRRRPFPSATVSLRNAMRASAATTAAPSLPRAARTRDWPRLSPLPHVGQHPPAHRALLGPMSTARLAASGARSPPQPLGRPPLPCRAPFVMSGEQWRLPSKPAPKATRERRDLTGLRQPRGAGPTSTVQLQTSLRVASAANKASLWQFARLVEATDRLAITLSGPRRAPTGPLASLAKVWWAPNAVELAANLSQQMGGNADPLVESIGRRLVAGVDSFRHRH